MSASLTSVEPFATPVFDPVMPSPVAAPREDRPDAAGVDELTGLPSRTEFGRQLARLVLQVGRGGGPGSLLLVDLDRFRGINHRYGQSAGDEILRQTATRLVPRGVEGVKAFRFGGGQFALLLDPVTAEEAVRYARDTFLSVHRPVAVAGGAIELSASFGLVMIEGDRTVDQLIRDVEVTVEAVKAGGGRQIYMHSPELEDWVEGRRREKDDLASEIERVRSENRALIGQAVMDPATGLPNRSAFDADHALVDARRRRDSDPYSLVLVDVDWFYDFNQRAGDAAGDAALVSLAGVIGSGIRPGDRCYRYGPDEFAVLLPGARGSEAVSMAENLRLQVETLGLTHEANPSGVLTVTVGVVEGGFRHASTGDVVTEVTDMVNSGKASGRNRIVWPH